MSPVFWPGRASESAAVPDAGSLKLPAAKVRPQLPAFPGIGRPDPADKVFIGFSDRLYIDAGRFRPS